MILFYLLVCLLGFVFEFNFCLILFFINCSVLVFWVINLFNKVKFLWLFDFEGKCVRFCFLWFLECDRFDVECDFLFCKGGVCLVNFLVVLIWIFYWLVVVEVGNWLDFKWWVCCEVFLLIFKLFWEKSLKLSCVIFGSFVYLDISWKLLLLCDGFLFNMCLDCNVINSVCFCVWDWWSWDFISLIFDVSFWCLIFILFIVFFNVLMNVLFFLRLLCGLGGLLK